MIIPEDLVLNEVRQEAKEDFPTITFLEGFDDCILGITFAYGADSVAAYDIKKIINKFMKEGLTCGLAEEKFWKKMEEEEWKSIVFVDTNS